MCLTAYTTRVAQILDRYCDLLLVGDSMGMVIYGMDTTRDVTIDMMINHGKAVMRGAQNACVIIDMSYGTYENNADVAVINAKRIMDETGASGLKLEGGADIAPTVAKIVAAGIPVMGHLGLLPQHVESRDGFRVQGRDDAGRDQLIKDAKAIEAAGAFSIVIEGVQEDTARIVTDMVCVPTIGIGASVACDGQILVSEDMLGITQDYVPKFVKQYADISQIIDQAAARYAHEVKNRTFPADAQMYKKKAS